MGDRANVVIKSKGFIGGDLVLYTHWNGSEVEQIVAQGIQAAVKAGRITDDSYGSRIIVEAFFAAHADKEAGAGIYVGSENEPHFVVIDLDDQTVDFDPAGNEYGPDGEREVASIQDFVKKFAAAKV